MKSQDVLKKLYELTAKHTKERLIGIDTLRLILGVGEPQLILLLQELANEGKIKIISDPQNSRRRTGSGSVQCINDNQK